MNGVVSIQRGRAQALHVAITQLKHTPHGTAIGGSDISGRSHCEAAIITACVYAEAITLRGRIEKNHMLQIGDG